MKRDHHHLYPSPNQEIPGIGGGNSSLTGCARVSAAAETEKAKVKSWEGESQNDGGMDELLAVLGYKVRSSDMAEVAQKLEQLEVVIGNAHQEDGLSQFVSDTVHYNPSDLSTWLESMLSELNSPQNFDPLSSPTAAAAMDDPYFIPPQYSTIFEDSPICDYDLKAIPGRAIYSSSNQIEEVSDTRDSKRLKPSVVVSSSSLSSPIGIWGVPSARPVVLVDSQENGIRLVHTLTACAEAIQQDDLKLAEVLVKQIGFLAASQAGAMGKVATFFAQALALRIYRFSSPQTLTLIDSMLSDDLLMNFYEACPFLRFAHFTANQAILEAFAGKSCVHVIDFSIKQGMQWPALMQALTLRPGGPPTFRLTGIGSRSPENDNTDRLREVGWKLAQFADTINVKFEYRWFVADSLADLDHSKLDLRPGEAVAMNSAFEMHNSLAVPGDIERVLTTVRMTKPEIVTVVEQEANHNGPVFMDRFMQCLNYYSTVFDSLEGTVSPVTSEDRVMSEVYLGRQICNVVACEGSDRVERHEQLAQWRRRFETAGFEPAHLGSNAFKQASRLLELFPGGEGYRVEENGGCLMLEWHTRPLIATSAWQLAGRGGKLRNPPLS